MRGYPLESGDEICPGDAFYTITDGDAVRRVCELVVRHDRHGLIYILADGRLYGCGEIYADLPDAVRRLRNNAACDVTYHEEHLELARQRLAAIDKGMCSNATPRI